VIRITGAAWPALMVFVRHAQSLRNDLKKGATYFADEEARRTVRGISDDKVPLTPRGEKQALITGVALRERFGVFDYVYHSGFQRTISTWEGIKQAYTREEQARMRVSHTLDVSERHAGWAYDMLQEEAERYFPWLKEYWQTSGGFFARPPGGESLAEVVDRVRMFLLILNLNQDHAGKKVLVNTHGGTLRCIRYELEGWTHEQALRWKPGEAPENCGTTVYRYDREAQHLVLQEHNTVYWNEEQLAGTQP
jgi:probable phosphoglycerate mutase